MTNKGLDVASGDQVARPQPEAGVAETPLSAVFQRAAEIVSRGWTQDAWARDCHGVKVGGSSFAAVAWDAGDAIFQAVRQVSGRDDFPTVRRACQAVAAHVGRPVGHWNDAPERTQAEVVATFRALAEAAQP